jgi:long-subunit acyl-CoA synthetase (AMP-forming)
MRKLAVDLLKNIKETMKGKLSTFEIPTKVELDDTIWTPETGLVTASMKIQRNEIRKFYNKPGGLLEKMQYKFPDK